MPTLRQTTIDTLKMYGLTPKRRLGQNFLINQIFLDQLIKSLDLKPTDHVLEIGPGIGTISERILASGAKLTAIELDPLLEEILESRFRNISRFSLIIGDAAKIELPSADKVIGNLPFSSASPILFNLGYYRFPLMILTFQEEVVQRMLAKSGTKQYGRLSVMSRFWFNIEKLFSLPPSAFYPKPEVLSTTVRVTPQKELFPTDRIELFHNVVTHLFIHRRQNLRKVLKPHAKRPNPSWLENLPQPPILLNRRVFTLTLDEIIQLVKWIDKQSKRD